MNLSYWEIKSWLTDVDFTIIGSGIVGLNCAIHLKNRFPKSKVLLLEKGVLPQGASTKNAGFACFGSLSELIDDLKHHSEEEVLDLVRQRVDGLQVLRSTLGDQAIDYQELGGYELFVQDDLELYEKCKEQKDRINSLLHPIFKAPVFNWHENAFGFENLKQHYSFNPFEGQIDTGKMMSSLLRLTLNKDIKILNNTIVEELSDSGDQVHIKTNHFEFVTSKVFVATNGFASQLLNEKIKPARAQVLITKPIKDLQIKGTFHLDRGYYYFRNIDNRILFGGGRNLDIKGEQTTELAQTKLIQDSLEELLKTTIFPNTPFEIDHRWSGIMGIGKTKKPVVKQIGNNMYCGVKLGGMGVAIGSSIGKKLAQLFTIK
ncbi:glycine/D-amino acid oxidase-like deaminating enzyme [Nonlabens dokdonensis]|uniref:Oxidoreductase n=2 Tax=Nonlabens dokdonensis TaxID=328515 RepID=L7WAY4_NONDD|nr:FAD-dependent oxidoreductase [Nonlabens dokdonensis]AGC77051.1 oxidoreductase [Nonlabens dokdonensis DSW-6]PZX41012.1 glycine/D-amino acid oxidase-like deaminating enzyme [Nonlabens dokdonensis]